MDKPSKYKVSVDVAENEFLRLCAARRVETEELSDYETAKLLRFKAKLLPSIRRGHLVVNDNGDPVYTPPVPGAPTLTFGMPYGANFVELDAESGEHHTTQRAVASLCGVEVSVIAKLQGPDWRVCGALAGLFMNAE